LQSLPIQQGTRLQSSLRASQIIIPPPGSRGTTQTRAIVSGAPGRFPTSAPFHFDGRHDFRRHHRFHRFPPFIFFGLPQFIGPAFVTAPFVPAVPFFPGTGWTWIEPGLSEIPRDYFGARGIDRLAPFDPTPQEVVERMLGLAAVHASDVVYDLGAGDGRVVITAAKKYGVKAVGCELDPGLAKLARENVHKQGVEKLVEIREQDFMSADLSPATVVTLYLSQDGNLAVRSKLLRELKPEARVVSYTFDMGDWQPKVVESYRDAGGNRHMLYFWQMSQPLLFSDGKR
jgi:precorrin-6B methylase 2